ncbi:MAG: hypothetical protein K0V04_20115 [Deltaproteobacteria bacterium]|nr:hypothetical protein [Deltaproteobacteria bacterium]
MHGGGDQGAGATVEQAPDDIESLEAQLAAHEGELLGAGLELPETVLQTRASEGRNIETAVGTTNEEGERCTRVCELASTICELRDHICGLSERRGRPTRYQRACERAELDCDFAEQACDDCEQ